MTKNCQVPLEFLYLVDDFLTGVAEACPSLPDEVHDIGVIIRNIINKKYDSLDRRDAYSSYKTAEPGSTKREEFRREYLDLANVHRDWRTTLEKFI